MRANYNIKLVKGKCYNKVGNVVKFMMRMKCENTKLNELKESMMRITK